MTTLTATEKLAKVYYEDIGYNVHKVPENLRPVSIEISKHIELKSYLKYGSPSIQAVFKAGVPDFLVWKNPTDYFFAEVKSKNSTLSSSQRNWIGEWSDTFDVEVIKLDKELNEITLSKKEDLEE